MTAISYFHFGPDAALLEEPAGVCLKKMGLRMVQCKREDFPEWSEVDWSLRLLDGGTRWVGELVTYWNCW